MTDPTTPDPEPTPDTAAHLRWVLAEIITDVTTDVQKLDGMPFTGATVAPALGGMAAAICALAETCSVLIERLEALEAARG